jgi:hypothetical protein
MGHSWSKPTGIVLISLLAACAESQPGETQDDAPSAAAAPSDTAWTVTSVAFGPLRFGTPVAEASTVLPGGFTRPPAADGCDYAHAAQGPRGVSFMVENGVVARIDVDSGTVKTAEGAGVGESDARVRELYQGRVEVQPHKYEPGHYYLNVRPLARADSMFRIVFESDGSTVTSYRAGVRPAVEYVERCG